MKITKLTSALHKKWVTGRILSIASKSRVTGKIYCKNKAHCYICQNKFNGLPAPETLGFRCSYKIWDNTPSNTKNYKLNTISKKLAEKLILEEEI